MTLKFGFVRQYLDRSSTIVKFLKCSFWNVATFVSVLCYKRHIHMHVLVAYFWKSAQERIIWSHTNSRVKLTNRLEKLTCSYKMLMCEIFFSYVFALPSLFRKFMFPHFLVQYGWVFSRFGNIVSQIWSDKDPLAF